MPFTENRRGEGSCDKMDPMRDEPQLRKIHKVSCLCGAECRVDPLNTDRHVICPSCGSSFDFVVTVDAGKRNPRLSIVLPRAAMKTEGESLGKTGPKASPPKAVTQAPKAEAPPPTPPVTRISRKTSGKTVQLSMANCECGASFPLEDTGELATMQSCPQCNRTYHVVFKLEPGTRKKTAIVVPDKPMPQKRTLAPSPKPSAGGKPDAIADIFTERRNRTKVVKKAARTSVPKPKPAPEIPPGAQGVPCSCGEMFVVRRKDLGSDMTCGGCGRKATFEEARDPQTLAPTLRIRAEDR
jgi:hypothetical protein